MHAFKQDLHKSLRNRNGYQNIHFQNVFVHTLYKHAPIEKKMLRLKMCIINLRRLQTIKSKGIFV